MRLTQSFAVICSSLHRSPFTAPDSPGEKPAASGLEDETPRACVFTLRVRTTCARPSGPAIRPTSSAPAV